MTIELHNVDCMEHMKTCKDNAFDLAIVDPPYGIGDTWSKSRSDRFHKEGRLYKYQNKSAPNQDYFDELSRVSENQIIWGGNYYAHSLPETNAWIVWNKQRHADVTYMSEAELAWTSFKSVMLVATFKWDGVHKCEVTDKVHPHQKPIELYKYCLRKKAKPGQRILDTHLGSGSSAIAAHYYGVDFVGCEIDEHYFTEAKARIERETAQVDLFEGVA